MFIHMFQLLCSETFWPVCMNLKKVTSIHLVNVGTLLLFSNTTDKCTSVFNVVIVHALMAEGSDLILKPSKPC